MYIKYAWIGPENFGMSYEIFWAYIDGPQNIFDSVWRITTFLLKIAQSILSDLSQWE